MTTGAAGLGNDGMEGVLRDRFAQFIPLAVDFGNRERVLLEHYRRALATAERYALEGRPQLALASAETALHGIPAGTPDHLRAQDLAMVAKAAAEKQRKDR